MSTLNKTGYNPTKITRPRSVFPLNQRHITTIKTGELVPILCEEILPGDTWSLDTSSVVRAAAPFVSPIYGDLTLSLYAFFVPNRLIWNHWFNFCGQNDEGAWTQKNDYVIPKSCPISDLNPGQIGDYLGIPQFSWDNEMKSLAVNELPLRGYVKIWNDWFRNENTQPPILMIYGDNENTAYCYNSAPLKVNKFHDRFTDCLPAPQKGDPVIIPLGDVAPLTTGPEYLNPGLTLKVPPTSTNTNRILGVTNDGKLKGIPAENPENTELNKKENTIANLNVYTDLKEATATTINQLRLATQCQVYLEQLARGGSRYNESTLSLFGVQTGDARAYKAELLGGVHIPLKMQEVVANSSSADNSTTQYALGQQVVKLTNGDNSSICTKSFVEHGFIYILACVRRQNQYYQGLERKWKRNTFLDFYNPIFDNIGEMPIYQNELQMNLLNTTPLENGGQVSWQDTGKDVFGYQEAWVEYRTFRDYITGSMVPATTPANTALPTYTFAQTLNNPTLPGIMEEDRKAIQRTMALTDLPFDFMCDFVTHGKVARTMSIRSIPGLLDHHGI